MPDRSPVDPITSLGDAQRRLHRAAADARAVADWLAAERFMNEASGRWATDLRRIALELDTLTHPIQFVGEMLDEDEPAPF